LRGAGAQAPAPGGADAGKLKLGIESLEGVLVRTGGRSTRRARVENVEFFLVAAIVILGIRTYFVQPFKIPTIRCGRPIRDDRGQPAPGAPAPNAAEASSGSSHSAHGAIPPWPEGRPIYVPFSSGANRPRRYTVREGRTWLVFPAKVKEYTFYVDGRPRRCGSPSISATLTRSS